MTWDIPMGLMQWSQHDAEMFEGQESFMDAHADRQRELDREEVIVEDE